MDSKKRYTIIISPLSLIYLLLALLLVWVMLQISGIIISLAVAAIFAIALNPVVTWLERKIHIRRGIAVAIVILLILGVFALILGLVIPNTITQAQTLARNWPNYQQRLQEFASHNTWLNWAYQHAASSLSKNSESVASNAAAISLNVAGGLFSFLTFFIFLIYMLASGRRFAVILSGLLPKRKWREQFVQVLHDISNKLGYWLRGQLVLCFLIFVVSYIGLSVLGVDYALTLALFAGLMEAVPMIGAYIGAIPAILVVLLGGSPGKAIAVAVLFLVIQQIEGNFVVPQVMKKAVGVHPMIVLLAAMIGGTLLGFVGVLIAVPVTAAASVVAGSLRSYFDDKIEK